MDRAEVSLHPEVVKSLVEWHYGLTVVSLNKVRAIYHVITPSGQFGFKSAEELPDLPFVASCLEQIRDNGFERTPRFRRSLAGDYLITHEKQTYFLEEWLSCEEIPKNSFPYLEKIGITLADFHRASRGIVPDRQSHRFEWGQRRERLQQTYSWIVNWRLQLALSPQEREILDFMLYRCQIAYVYIQQISPKLLIDRYPETAVLCHGGLHHKNLMIDQKQNIWLIDFETLAYTERVMDLAQFLQYHAIVYGWNPRVVDTFLRAYTSRLERSIGPEEWNMFLSYVAFPRRILNRAVRYFENPTRPPAFLIKLRETLEQEVHKEPFLSQNPMAFLNRL